MRLDIDNQVLTQLNKHCLFAIKFSRSVEFAASQSYLLNSITTRLNARPVYTRQSLKQTMQYKHLLSHTSYVMQHLLCNPKLCKHLHQLQSRTSNANTCYAKHLLLMQTTASNSRQRTAPLRYAHQTRNLSKFRPNFQPKFPTQTHVDFSMEPQHNQSKQTDINTRNAMQFAKLFWSRISV